ncbi:hypothetical protein OTU49_016866 [Cherax quadricarinatus]|uniref:Uncharacterized protein n=1 Tax=Cherax quadricarinatus TaxID=27406 RepID=A0AAW0Y484_CHEQU
MFKWFQNRLQKGSRHSTSEFEGEDNTVIFEYGQVEVATEAVQGEVDTEAVSGKVDAEAVPYEVDTKVVHCKLHTEAVQGKVDAKVVRGDVDGERVQNEVNSETVQGKVNAEELYGDIDMETVHSEVESEATQGSENREAIQGDDDAEAVLENVDAEAVMDEVDAEGVQNQVKNEVFQGKEDTEAGQAKVDTDTVPSKEDTEAVQAQEGTETVKTKEDTEAVKAKEDTEAVQAKEDTEAVQTKDHTENMQAKDTEAGQDKVDTEALQDKGDTEVVQAKEDAEALQDNVDTEALQDMEDTQPVQANEGTDVVQAKEVTEAVQAKEVTEAVQAKEVTEAVQAKEVTEAVQAKEVTEAVQAKEVTEAVQAKEVTEAVQAKEVTEAVQAKEVTEAVQAKEVTEAVQAKEVTEAVQAKEVTEVVQAKVNSETVQAKVDTEAVQDKEDIEAVQVTVDTEAVQGKMDTETVQYKVDTEEVQDKVNTKAVQAKVDAETVQSKEDTETVQEKGNTDAVRTEVDSEAVQDKVDTEAVQVKMDIEAVQAKVDTEAVQAKEDTETVQAKMDTETVQANVDTEAVQDKLDTEAVQAKEDTEAVQAKVDTEAVQAKVDTEAVQAKVDTEGVQAKVDTEAVQAKEDTETVQAKVDTEAVQANVDTEAVQDKVDTEAVQSKEDTETVQAKVDIEAVQAKEDTETVQAKVDTEAVQTKVDTEALQAKEDTEAVQDKMDTEAVQTKVDTEAVQAKVDTEAVQDKVDTEAVQAKVDIKAVQAKEDAETVQAKVDTEAVQDKIDTEAVHTKVDIEAVQAKEDAETVQAKVDTETVQAKVDIEAVQAKEDTETVQAKVDTEAVQAKVDTETMHAKADIEAVQAKEDTETVQAKVDTEAVQAKVDTEAVQAKADTETMHAKVDIEAVQANEDTEALQDKVDTESVQGKVDTETVQASMDTEAVLFKMDTEAVQGKVDTEAVWGEVDTEATQCEVHTEAFLNRVDAEAVQHNVSDEPRQGEVDAESIHCRLDIETGQDEMETYVDDDFLEDYAQRLKCNPFSFIDQCCAQMPYFQNLACDIHEDQVIDSSCNIIEAKKCKILSKSNDHMQNIFSHEMKTQVNSLKQKLQDPRDEILFETQEKYNIPGIEIKEIVAETLNQNISSGDNDLIVRQKHQEVHEHGILPEFQCIISLSSPENVGSPEQQILTNTKQEDLGMDDSVPILELLHSDVDVHEWKGHENYAHVPTCIEDVSVLDKSDLGLDNACNNVSTVLPSEHHVEVGDNDDIQGVNDNTELTISDSAQMFLFSGTKLDFDNEESLEVKTDTYNQHSFSEMEKMPDFFQPINYCLQDKQKLEEESARDEKGSTTICPLIGHGHQVHLESLERIYGSSSKINTLDPYLYPHPHCPQLSCFYNHHGKLCTVLNKHFILTYIKEAPVLINLYTETSASASFGGVLVWRMGKPSVLQEFPDGTEICFDAVIMPNDTKYTALVIWQGIKPKLVIEPYFKSYVFVEELQDLEVDFIIFHKENGLVSTIIGEEIKIATFCKSVVFISGKKVQSTDDIQKLKECGSQLYANVIKLVSIGYDGKIVYGFMCSCLWSGIKPSQLNLPTEFNHVLLYKKRCGHFAKRNRQLYLYCDVDVELIVNEKGHSLVYKSENEEISFPCTHKVYCGNRKVLPAVGGQVKAHIKKQISKTGALMWDALMVQIPDKSLVQVCETCAADVHEYKESIREISSLNISKEKCLPLILDGNNEPQVGTEETGEFYEKRILLNDTGRRAKIDAARSELGSNSDIMKLNKIESTLTFTEEHIVNDNQAVSSHDNILQMDELMDMDSEKTYEVRLETNSICSVLNSNCDQKTYTESVRQVSDNILNEVESVIKVEVKNEDILAEFKCIHKVDDCPQVMKNCSGKLSYVANLKVFNIYTELNGKPFEVHVGSGAWLVNSGVASTVEKSAVAVPISFDFYFDKSLPHGHRIAAMWVGEKPHKAVNKNVIYYFDIPGIYCGLCGEDMNFRVCVDDTIIFINASNTDRVFSSDGKHCKSIPLNASVVLHLRKSTNKVTGIILWKVPLIIVEAQNKNLTLESRPTTQFTPSSRSPSLCPVEQSLSEFIDNPNRQLLLESVQYSNHSSVKKPSCYTSLVDLPRYIKNFTGILILNETDKVALFSCLNGTALWTSIPQNGFVCVDGIAVEITDIPLGTGLMFDAFCDNPSHYKYSAVMLWTGNRPHQAKCADGTKYFYDVKGVYYGVRENKFQMQLHLDGEIKDIECQKTGRIITEDGSIDSKGLVWGDRISVHLKCKVNLNSYQVILMFMFIEKDLLEKSKSCNEKRIFDTHCSILNGTHTLVPQTNIRSEKADFLQKIPKECSENISVVADSRGVTPKHSLSEKCDIPERLPCTSQIKELDTVNEDAPSYLKDCSGILVNVDGCTRAITSLFREPLTILLSEYQRVYLENGTVVNVGDVPVNSAVKFDALLSSTKETDFCPLMVWVEKRPSVLKDVHGNRYFYDVEGTYIDTQCGLFKLFLKLDKQWKYLLVKEISHVYFLNGRKAQHALTHKTKILMHLREGYVEDEFGLKYKAIVIFVIDESPLRQLQDPDHSIHLVNLEEKEKALNKTFDLDTVNKNKDQHQSYDEKVGTDVAEHNPSSIHYSVFEGKVVETKASIEYKFTYTHEGNTRTLLIPADITLDKPSQAKSVMEFYLLTRKSTLGKRATPYHPICGWFHRKSHDAYVIHCLKIQSFNPKTQLISLINPADESLHYFQCDSEYLFMGRTKSLIENACRNLNVHAVVEDITPCIVQGVSVQKRVLLLTSNMGLSQASLKFLVLSQVENETNESKSDNHVDAETDYLEQPQLNTCNNSSSNNISCNSKEHDFERLKLKQTRPIAVNDQICEDKDIDDNIKHFEDNDKEENIKPLPIEEDHLEISMKICSENKRKLSQVEHEVLEDSLRKSLLEENILSGEKLERMISKKLSDTSTMQSAVKYLTLKGDVLHGHINGNLIFECEEEYRHIRLPSDILCFKWRNSERYNKKNYLLVYKMFSKKTKDVIYHPLFIWHGRYKCSAYILINQKIVLFNPENNLLVIANDQNNSCQYCSVENNSAFTSTVKMSISDFCGKKNEIRLIYFVVEDIPPISVGEYIVNKKILLVSSSFDLALSSISTFSCNKSDSNLISVAEICKLDQLYQIYEERRNSAYQCKEGHTYYLWDNNFDIQNMKYYGGYLQFYTEKYAFILCGKKKFIAVCHISSTYYQGRNISSWDEIDKKFWKNFFVITCPLEKEIKIEYQQVDVMALVGWSCSAPDILAVHTCHLHTPTLFVCKDIASIEEEAIQLTNPHNNELPRESSACAFSSECYEENSKVITANEIEISDCMAGSNIFSMHEQILKSCGLRRTVANLTYFEKHLVVCTSELGEMVWCYLSDFYIHGVKCHSIKDLLKQKKQKCTLVIVHYPAVVLQGKTVNLKGVIGFIGSEVLLPGIHICNYHKGILLNVKKEEIVIAKEIFNDIQAIYEQSVKYAAYLLENLCDTEIEQAVSLINAGVPERYLEFQGVLVNVNDTDPNKAMASIQLRGKEHYVLVHHEVFIGLNKGMLLNTVVGCPIKGIIDSSESSNYFKKFRVMRAWRDLSRSLSPELEVKIPVNKSFMITEGICCPRAHVIQHFELLHKRPVFKILMGKKISSNPENSKIVFKCTCTSKNVIEVICEKHSLRTQDASSYDDNSPWCILVHYINNLCAPIEGVAAWKGNVANLITQVCDVHKIQLLDLIFVNDTKEDKPAFVSEQAPLRVKSNSESLYYEPLIPVSFHVKNTTRSRSNPLINGLQVEAASSTLKDYTRWGFGSLPSYLESSSGFEKGVEVEYINNFTDEKSLAKSENQLKMYSPAMKALDKDCEDITTDPQFITETSDLTLKYFDDDNVWYSASEKADMASLVLSEAQISNTHKDDDTEPVEDSESDRNIQMTPSQCLEGNSMSYIESSKFECLDEFQGIIQSSDINILIRCHNLYFNMSPLNEPLTELIKNEENCEVKAMIVCLSSPISVLGYTVTHEAVIAWVGKKPWQADNLEKIFGLNRFHDDKHEQEELVANLKTQLCPEDSEVGVEKDTIMIADDAPQTLYGCGYSDSCFTHGILRSSSGYILFTKELVYRNKVRMNQHKKIKKILYLKSINALMMKLKFPVKILDCQVTNIALLVWVDDAPEDVQYTITDSLDFYKKNWNIEFYIVQNQQLIDVVLAKSATYPQTEGDTAGGKQKPKVKTQYSPPVAQTWIMKNIDVKLEREIDREFDVLLENTERFIKAPSRWENSQCKIILVGNKFTVLESGNKTAVVQKDRFYIDGIKLLSSRPISEQLGDLRAVVAYLIKIEKPLYIQQYIITDFAVLAFAGKKPKGVQLILDHWQEQAGKKINLSTKTKLMPVPQKNLGVITHNKKKSIDSKSAVVFKLFTASGILEVQSKVNEEKVRIFFSKDQVYVNKKPVPLSSSLTDHMAPFVKQPWNCSARLFPQKKNKAGHRKICGIEAHYIANLVWYGEMPSKEERNTNKLMEQNKRELTSKQKGTSLTDTHLGLASKIVGKNMTQSSCSQESSTSSLQSSSQESSKSESVAERLKKQVQSAPEGPEIDIDPSTGAKRKIKKSLESWTEEKKSAAKGFITELHCLIGRLCLENGDHVYFSREKCFLYGVCLNKFELWHVLSVGIVVDYEYNNETKDLKGVWAGSSSTIEPSSLLSKLQDWCEEHSVPDAVAHLLLKEAGWLPSEFDPTFDVTEDKEVVNCHDSP